MARTIIYFTGTSGSDTVFFTNEDASPDNLTNIKKRGQKVFPLKYHEIDSNTLAIWQFDGNLSGIGPEATDMEVLAGATELYGAGPVLGRKAFFGNNNRSLRMSTTTGSLQLSGSVTHLCLFYPNESTAPGGESGATKQVIIYNGGDDASGLIAENTLSVVRYGTSFFGLQHGWQYGAGVELNVTPSPPQMLLQRKWNHLAISLSIDGTATKMYVNGKRISYKTGMTPPNGGTNSRPRVLGPQTSFAAQATGLIASYKIVGKELTEDEVYKEAKRTLGDAI